MPFDLGPRLRGKAEAENREERRRRRAFSAAAIGCAIFVGLAGLAVGGYATAIGGAFHPMTPVADEAPAPSVSTYSEPLTPTRHAHKSSGGGGSFAYGKAVCVRLCDGFFFPTVSTVGGDAACAEQCPDAPVAMYSQPSGSDRIEDAISLTGARYSALPVALRHETTFDDTCTCHRASNRPRVSELLHDFTLRRGDLVMTSNGFTVYEGGGGGSAAPGDFVALAKAPNVSKSSREELTAMERAGAYDRQNGNYRAPVAAETDTDPAPARGKGMVTVEDARAASAR
jgi:hypothetical protein